MHAVVIIGDPLYHKSLESTSASLSDFPPQTQRSQKLQG